MDVVHDNRVKLCLHMNFLRSHTADRAVEVQGKCEHPEVDNLEVTTIVEPEINAKLIPTRAKRRLSVPKTM